MKTYIAELYKDDEWIDETSIDENSPDIAREVFEENGYDLNNPSYKIKVYEVIEL